MNEKRSATRFDWIFPTVAMLHEKYARLVAQVKPANI